MSVILYVQTIFNPAGMLVHIITMCKDIEHFSKKQVLLELIV